MNRLCPKIGEILVSRGVLTPAQLEHLLDVQASNPRPLGLLAEQLLGVSSQQVETAWRQQYESYDTAVDLDRESVDDTLTGLVDARQAWQFQIVPLRRGRLGLTVVTTPESLARATVFAWRHFGEPVVILTAEREQMERHLTRRYPWAAGAMLTRRRWPITQPVAVKAEPDVADQKVTPVITSFGKSRGRHFPLVNNDPVAWISTSR